jgi:enoyl-CoA hydratase/carnithine racemase
MIVATRHDRVIELALARPRAANALDERTYAQLKQALAEAILDPTIDALVISAQGERAFCAGADLKEYSGLAQAAAALRRREALLSMLDALLDFPKPAIAAIHAPAIGAGAMLVLACDEIVASPKAWIGFPEIAADMPSPMGVSMVARRAGYSIVQRLVQRGERLDADAALRAHLVDEIVDAEALPARAMELARERGALSAAAYAANKRWMNRRLKRELAAAAAWASRVSSTTSMEIPASIPEGES